MKKDLDRLALCALLSLLLILCGTPVLTARAMPQLPGGSTSFDDFDTSLDYSGLWNHEFLLSVQTGQLLWYHSIRNGPSRTEPGSG